MGLFYGIHRTAGESTDRFNGSIQRIRSCQTSGLYSFKSPHDPTGPSPHNSSPQVGKQISANEAISVFENISQSYFPAAQTTLDPSESGTLTRTHAHARARTRTHAHARARPDPYTPPSDRFAFVRSDGTTTSWATSQRAISAVGQV